MQALGWCWLSWTVIHAFHVIRGTRAAFCNFSIIYRGKSVEREKKAAVHRGEHERWTAVQLLTSLACH